MRRPHGVYIPAAPVTADLEDTIYACRNCGAELIRTSVRQVAGRPVDPA